MSARRIGERGLVLGGSIAGLLAARVLADVFDQVTVVERDALPHDGSHSTDGVMEYRKGVPQGRHIHGLMPGGQRALEVLFPGLGADLQARGAPVLDQLGQARILLGGHRFVRTHSGLNVVSASRPLLERCVRDRVRALPNVEFVDGCDVVGVRLAADRSRVTGAHVLPRADSSAAEVLHADLLVDALGRSSPMPRWLHELGLTTPDEDRVASDVGYASMIVRLAPDALQGDLAVINGPRPGQPRGAGLATIEGDRCILTLMGMTGAHPPTDPAGVIAFVRSLEFPDIADALGDHEALGRIAGFRVPASLWRRYDRLGDLPGGMVSIGDAMCSFNPIYGQGITVAALQALTLHHHLERGPLQTRELVRELAKVVSVPWTMSAGADLAFPGVQGARTASIRIANAYVARTQAAAEHDPRVAISFLRVAGMVDPPQQLFSPAFAGRVLLHAPRPRRSSASPTLLTRSSRADGMQQPPDVLLRSRERRA